MGVVSVSEREVEIKARAEAATPGPWISDGMAHPWKPSQRSAFDDRGASIDSDATIGHRQEVVVGGAQEEQGGAVGVLLNHDAEFIAHARADVPWLLVELAAARAQAEHATTQFNRAMEMIAQTNLERDALACENERLRTALGPLRQRLAPEWWREDERDWYVTCSVCDVSGPREDFWHFDDCVLGAILAAAAGAPATPEPITDHQFDPHDPSHPHICDVCAQCKELRDRHQPGAPAETGSGERE